MPYNSFYFYSHHSPGSCQERMVSSLSWNTYFQRSNCLTKAYEWEGIRKREVDNQSIVDYADSFQGPQWCGWKQLISNLKIMNNGEAALSTLRGVQRSNVANLPGVRGGNTPVTWPLPLWDKQVSLWQESHICPAVVASALETESGSISLDESAYLIPVGSQPFLWASTWVLQTVQSADLVCS